MGIFTAVQALVAVSSLAIAQPASLDDTSRAGAIADVGAVIAEHYFDAELGAAIEADLASFSASSDVAGLVSGEALADVLGERLRAHDRHFQLQWRGPADIARIQAAWDAAGPEPAESPDRWDEYRAQNYGFADARVLAGNIGYLNLTTFNPLIVAQAKADAALSFLSDTDALIIDLRENRGGEPELVRYLLSHFMPEGEAIHYNTLLPRNGDAEALHTIAHHPLGHRPDVPLFLLVSERTFSAAEALAYHLQASGRATVVGEQTGGGANPGALYLAESGFVIFIPDTTSRSPLTGGNWDASGVQPDIEVSAESALNRARVAVLDRQSETAAIDTPQAMQAAYQLAVARNEAGGWTPTMAELEACAGNYNGGRVWIEGDQLFYQGSSDALPLLPFAPGVFRFPDSEQLQVHFPGYQGGRARAMRQAYPSGNFFDRERVD